ncbi:hypothetical protein [Jiangella asiatica]|uniref:YfhO family protein n=1 Tax=Jiangella asiatica TaxID=2530372 RepID=A0A4R5D2K5_9ACTN|nr:hypothetical protein [Jiangella asiatica]TDE07406.1 hypothetical protein E1269_20225 [Jiangella asiatica]
MRGGLLVGDPHAARHRRSSPATHSPRAHGWLLPAWCVLLTAVVLAPLAAPGFVLSYDMVAVPDQALLPSSVGLGSAVPRAVPLDAAVAILDSVVTGAVLQKLALAGILLAAMLGAGRALPDVSTGARLVTASVYGWNAYVFERLVIGHWPTLIAYAALPWLLMLGRAVRRGRMHAASAGLGITALASLTPTGGLLAAALFAAIVLAPGGRQTGRLRTVVGVSLVALQAPWVVPSVLRPDPAVSDAAGVAAFASQADSPAGLVGSLLTLGGIWNEGAVPDSRDLLSALVLAAVLLVLAAIGLGELRRRLGRAEFAALAGLSVLGGLLAVAGAVPGTAGLVEWLVAEVPGGGLVRDGQKFLAWYALLVALAAAVGTGRVARALPGRLPALAATAAAVVLPLAALPDLAWGAAGRLTPVAYPAAWDDVRAALQASDGDGDLVVLPYQPFRRFPWNDDHTVLDPAPRYLGVETVVPDALPVGGVVVPGEDRRAEHVGAVLAADGDNAAEELAAAGVGWIAVERDTPGELPEAVLKAADPVEVNGTLDLYRLPESARSWTRIPPSEPVIAADIVFLAILVAASVDVVRNAFLPRRRSLRSRVS